jgi:hypothetical protein
MKILIALAAIIVAGFLVGFSVGKLTSPDYTVQANVLQHIYSHIDAASTDGHPVYTFSCGGKTWAYDVQTDSVTPDYSSPLVVLKMRKTKNFKTMNLNMMYSIVGGGPTAVIGGIKFIDYVAPLTKNQRVAFAIAAVLTTVSGAYWGYRLGFSDELDCNDKMVQTILNDVNMWRTYKTFRQRIPIGVKM